MSEDAGWCHVEAIKALKAAYFRFLDAKDYDGLEAIFTDDAVIDVRGSTTAPGDAPTVAGLDDGVMTGRAFKLFLRTGIGDLVTVHHGHMPEITLTGPDSAEAIWAMEDQIWFPPGAPHRKLHGWGHYHDRYRLEQGRWQVSAMRISRIRVELLDWPRGQAL